MISFRRMTKSMAMNMTKNEGGGTMKKRTIAIVLAELDELYAINGDEDKIIELEWELKCLCYNIDSRIY